MIQLHGSPDCVFFQGLKKYDIFGKTDTEKCLFSFASITCHTSQLSRSASSEFLSAAVCGFGENHDKLHYKQIEAVKLPQPLTIPRAKLCTTDILRSWSRDAIKTM